MTDVTRGEAIHHLSSHLHSWCWCSEAIGAQQPSQSQHPANFVIFEPPQVLLLPNHPNCCCWHSATPVNIQFALTGHFGGCCVGEEASSLSNHPNWHCCCSASSAASSSCKVLVLARHCSNEARDQWKTQLSTPVVTSHCGATANSPTQMNAIGSCGLCCSVAKVKLQRACSLGLLLVWEEALHLSNHPPSWCWLSEAIVDLRGACSGSCGGDCREKSPASPAIPTNWR